MVGVKSVSLAVLFLVHGAYASCNGTDAELIVQHLNQFRSMLVDYATLGNSLTVAAAAASSSHHKRAVDAKTSSHSKQLVQSVKAEAHSHVAPKAQISVVTINQSNKPSAAREEAHENTHAQVNQKQPQRTYQDPEQQLRVRIRRRYRRLARRQYKLDAMSGSCIPDSHKLQIASALTKVLTVYTTQEKGLKAAGKLIDASKPLKKIKKKPSSNKANSMQKREVAGWLTMNDEVNAGYNDKTSLLARKPSVSTASVNVEEDNAPREATVPSPKAVYITVTTTESITPKPATLAKHKASATSSQSTDADDESDDGSDADSDTDSDTDSEDDESSTAHISASSSTSKHHNVIVRTVDGTFHLVTGTVGFALHLFGIGGGSKKSIEHSELSKLVEDVSKLYEVKL